VLITEAAIPEHGSISPVWNSALRQLCLCSCLSVLLNVRYKFLCQILRLLHICFHVLPLADQLLQGGVLARQGVYQLHWHTLNPTLRKFGAVEFRRKVNATMDTQQIDIEKLYECSVERMAAGWTSRERELIQLHRCRFNVSIHFHFSFHNCSMSLFLPPVKPPVAALSASQNLIEQFGLTDLYNKLCSPSSASTGQISSPLPPTFKCYIEHLPGNLDDLIAKSTVPDEDDDEVASTQLQQLLNPAFRGQGFAKHMIPFTEEQLADSFSLQVRL